MYPIIKHYNNNDRGILKEGMVFTIEPIFCIYPMKKMKVLKDGFSVIDKDNFSA